MRSNRLERGVTSAVAFILLVVAARPGLAALDHSVIVPLVEEVATIPSPPGKDGFGQSVATQGDVVVIGAPNFSTANPDDSVYVYRREGNAFTLAQTLVFSEAVPDPVTDLPPIPPNQLPRSARFGSTVALDGSSLFVSANHSSTGGLQAVYVFERLGGQFQYRQTLQHPDQPVAEPTHGGSDCEPCFGRYLAADDGTLVVSGGGVFVYTQSAGTWELGVRLSAPPGVSTGGPVAIDGDTVVAGRSVFVRNGPDWRFQEEITLPPSFCSGQVKALDGNRLLVGCRGTTEDASSAWLFERDPSGDWGQAQELVAQDATFDERFGTDVALSGDTLAVASLRAIWLFQDQGSGWSALRTLERPGGGILFLGKTLYALLPPGSQGGLGAVTVYAESYTDQNAVSSVIRPALYDPDARAAGVDPDAAAFRYVHRLYQVDASGEPAPAYDQLEQLYGPEEFEKSLRAEELLETAIRQLPQSFSILTLRLLEIYHDRTVAAQLLAAQRLAEAEEVKLGLTAPAPCDVGEVIDREICLLERAVQAYEWAIQGGIDANSAAAGRGYFDLLQGDFGVADVDGVPFGYAAFRETVPVFFVQPARYLDPVTQEVRSVGGSSKPLFGDPQEDLFSGYRDVVVLFGLLRDTARTASRLAKLYAARGDMDLAADQIGDSHSMLLALGQVLLGVFPGLETEIDTNSGVRESIAAWRDSLTELTTLAQLVRGDSNPLGFDDDFLIFMPSLPEIGPGVFDSYDRFATYVKARDSRPLREALIALNGDPASQVTGAKLAYASHRDGQDQVETQLAALSTTVGNRLAEIVGAHPDAAFAYEQAQQNPRVFGGSGEVAQQLFSIDAAVLVIQRNRQEIDNLRAKVGIELARSAAAQGAIIDYGDRQATLTEEIAQIVAGQAIAEAAAEGLTSLGTNPFQLIFGLGSAAANAGAQAGLEELKAEKEARKERLAAAEKAELVGIDSAAQVQTWLLDMSLLAIDSQQAALLLRQETARLKALVDEKNRLETQLEEARGSLARRYFADPIHRLRAEASIRRATLTFERAQRWLYYMARALEYKWNVTFRQVEGARVWTADSAFGLRNADELDALFQAMEDFNQGRIFTLFQPQLDVISLRRDVLGTASDAEFAGYLAQLPRDEFGDAVVTFSTAREFPGTGLFLRSTTLDKIDRMAIALPGSHTRNTDFGSLKYAGTSLVRTVNRPRPGPQSDRQPDEFRSYSTRSWRSDLLTGELVADDGLQVPAQLLLESAPPDSCSASGVDWILGFKERSVAATGWELTIPGRLLDRIDDVEIYVCHQWAPRGF